MADQNLSLMFDQSAAPATIDRRYPRGGVPVHRFRKEIMREGEYVKDGVRYKVDAALLDHWAATFSQMQQSGIGVPVPAGHTTDPEKNHGWTENIVRKGKSLFADLALYGDDAPRLAASNQVSVYVPATATDGKGATWTKPIRHIALTPYPVVPGLGGWVPLAASQEPDSVSALTLERKQTMDLKKLKDELKFEQDLTEENAADLICSLVGDLRKEIGELKAKADQKPDPKPELKPDAKPDAMVMSLTLDNRKMKLERLVMAGKISPAVRDEVAKQFISEDAVAMAFSMDGKDGFESILTVLDKLPEMAFGEQTGPQILELKDKAKAKQSEDSMEAAVERYNARMTHKVQ